MNFDDVWFGENLNSKKTPLDGANTSPANLLWETAKEAHTISTKLDELTTPEIDYDKLADKVAGKINAVDYDKLAEVVADVLAKRMAE